VTGTSRSVTIPSSRDVSFLKATRADGAAIATRASTAPPTVGLLTHFRRGLERIRGTLHNGRPPANEASDNRSDGARQEASRLCRPEDCIQLEKCHQRTHYSGSLIAHLSLNTFANASKECAVQPLSELIDIPRLLQQFLRLQELQTTQPRDEARACRP